MTFLSPHRLVALAGVAVLALAYLALSRRRRHYAVRFTNLDLLSSLAPRRPGWRRHLSAAGVLAGLVVLVVGFAQPVRPERVPKRGATVVLVLDVSLSMGATDVSPSRIAAAQEAAGDFVAMLPPAIRLGLVVFDANARVLVPPGQDRASVIRAIENLTLGRGTGTGEAVFAALGSIEGFTGDSDADDDPAARVVLMSDGHQTTGRPLDAAGDAAEEAGVAVWTIAYGTDHGSILVDGERTAVPSDPPAMRDLAAATGGRSFAAASAAELAGVYEDIGSTIGHTTEEREYTATLVGIALALLAAASGAGLLWSARFL